MSRNSDHRLIARLVVGLLLGLIVLIEAESAHALSIGGQISSRVVTREPTPENPFLFEFEDRFSCLPGFGCGDVISRYAVRGTSQSAIAAQFDYRQETQLGGYSVFFQATDLNGRLLARVRTNTFGDQGSLEATSCGPTPGVCVSYVVPTPHPSGFLPGDFDPTVPRFPEVGEAEFFARAAGGEVTHGIGLLPFYLPVGPGTGIRARLQLEIFNRLEDCNVSSPLDCNNHLFAAYTLIALPPQGASFLEPVPEPATLLLVGTTAAGLGLARWRQRRKQRAVGSV